jgi:hypothetical protein
MMSSRLSYIKRSDIEAANKQYTPTKIFLAVFGCIAVLMLFTVFTMFLWFRRQDKKERVQQAAKDAAMAEMSWKILLSVRRSGHLWATSSGAVSFLRSFIQLETRGLVTLTHECIPTHIVCDDTKRDT